MKNTTVLFDTNVVIDIIEKRKDFFPESKRVFDLCMDGFLTGFIAAQSIADIFYILRKKYTAGQRKKLLRDMCDVFDVVGTGKEHVLSALSDDTFDDLEDCILTKCAEDHDFDFIVSRDKEDFASSKISVVTPLELLKILTR